MALQFIQQDFDTFHEAYHERKAEYDTLRAAERWPGAMLKTSILTKLRATIEAWAHIHNVEITLIDIQPSGISSNVHVIVVARKGFEIWRRSERHDNLFDFIHTKLSLDGDLFISRLSAMTEEEYERCEGAAV